ncbi:MAG TPA: hypothetical protein VLD67_15920, partial [Vicinamibacterales bacterium]|nr:hypothetical protein [Vicinamibacterales bacterium]
QGLAVALAGATAGLAAAFAAGRFVEELLYGVRVTDPVTSAGAAAIVLAVAALGCVLPARRATRIDPLIALRIE